jgi:Na+-driven multidrug efflux pump
MILWVALSNFFTTDSIVLEAVSKLIPLLAIFVLLNGIQLYYQLVNKIIKTNTSFGFSILESDPSC